MAMSFAGVHKKVKQNAPEDARAKKKDFYMDINIMLI